MFYKNITHFFVIINKYTEKYLYQTYLNLKKAFISELDGGKGIFASLFTVMDSITGGPIRTAIVSIVGIGAAIKGISDAIESAKFEKAEQLTEGFDDAKTSIDEYKVKVDELKTELENGIRDISDYSGISHFFTL